MELIFLIVFYLLTLMTLGCAIVCALTGSWETKFTTMEASTLYFSLAISFSFFTYASYNALLMTF